MLIKANSNFDLCGRVIDLCKSDIGLCGRVINLCERIIDECGREGCHRFDFISIHLLKISRPSQRESLHIFCEDHHVVCEGHHVVCEVLHAICETLLVNTGSLLFCKIQLHQSCEALHF